MKKSAILVEIMLSFKMKINTYLLKITFYFVNPFQIKVV